MTESEICDYCLDTGWVENYDLPDDDDTPKPCEHCDKGKRIAAHKTYVEGLPPEAAYLQKKIIDAVLNGEDKQ